VSGPAADASIWLRHAFSVFSKSIEGADQGCSALGCSLESGGFLESQQRVLCALLVVAAYICRRSFDRTLNLSASRSSETIVCF
jgi:hypothetical protein